MALQIIWNDILQVETEAIVTMADRDPSKIGTGIDRIICRAAGEKKVLEGRKGYSCFGPGHVGVTDGFGLSRTKCGAKKIIHALALPWGDGLSNQEWAVDGCYLRILCKAHEIGARTVSMPVISSGKMGMPDEEAIRVACRAIGDFLAGHPRMTVKLVVIDAALYDAAVRLCGGDRTVKFEIGFAPAQQKKLRAGQGKGKARYSDAEGSEDNVIGIDEAQDAFLRERVARDAAKYRTINDLLKYLWDDFSAAEKKAQENQRIKRKCIWKQGTLATMSGVDAKKVKKYLDTTARRVPHKDDLVSLLTVMRVHPLYFLAAFGKTEHAFDSGDSRDAIIMGYIASRRGSVDELNRLLEENGRATLNRAIVD